MSTALAALVLVTGLGLVLVGAELFAERLEGAARGLGVTAFAMAVVLAGSEPEELATAVAGTVRGVPAVSFGDVIGANIAACLVALSVGAFVAPLPFGPRVRRYALLAFPVGVAGAIAAWGGVINRLAGALLVMLYVAFVVVVWLSERRHAPVDVDPAGEAAAHSTPAPDPRRSVAFDVVLVLAGVALLTAGSVLLVEAVQSISEAESVQTDLSLTLVGFATTVELVVVAWSTARRGATDAVVGAVFGSFAFNMSLSLGVAALAGPLGILDVDRLRVPLLVMLAAFLTVIVVGSRSGRIGRASGLALLTAYAAFVAYIALT